MSEVKKAFLEKIHIKNFLSLRDVTFPFKPLTVLVGPNASGKSNTLLALHLLNRMMVDDSLPLDELIMDSLWTNEAQKISFGLETKVEKNKTSYHLEVKAKPNFSFHEEQLSVNDANVISIENGHGVVRDENGKNETTYNSNKLALGSAGNYGNKPITRALTGFIKEWEFYDFSPNFMRNNLATISHGKTEIRGPLKLDTYGVDLANVLWNWHKYSPESFRNISDSLAASTNREIVQRSIDGKNQLCLLEGYKNPIPLYGASDGTLRLVAYYILLNEPELPPLIAIEEPERNLHPGALTDIANVLEQIAERSQVVITTHSSQLLDAFNPASLSDSLGILLLHNRLGFGTEAHHLEEYRGKREALQGWIDDFGIGSAIFDSELLQDILEDKSECQA